MEPIVLYIISLLVLYIVIEAAVRKGINNSVIGQFLEKKHGFKEDKKSLQELLENDLDSDK